MRNPDNYTISMDDSTHLYTVWYESVSLSAGWGSLALAEVWLEGYQQGWQSAEIARTRDNERSLLP